MKHFYYTAEIINRSKVCGTCSIKCNVYVVENDKLKPVTVFTYNTAFTKGERAEVYMALVKAGQIPAEYQSGNSYFGDKPREYCTIQAIDEV